MKELLGIDRAAQPFELHPLAGADHLGNRACQRIADAGQLDQAVDTTLVREGMAGLLQRPKGVRRTPIGRDAKGIGMLLLQKVGSFEQDDRRYDGCLRMASSSIQ